MKITKVRVSYGVTRNMGNYESLRLDYGAEVEIPTDDPTVNTKVPYSDSNAAIVAFYELRGLLRSEIAAAVKDEMEFLHGKDKPTRRG